MAFTGARYKLGFIGSFNGSEDIQLIPPGSYTTGSRNLNTHNNGAEKRGGTTHVGSQISASLKSLGGGMLVKYGSGSRHEYFAGDDGELYRDGLSIVSGRSTNAYNHFTSASNKMFICNGLSAPQVDTGTSVADLATPTGDWTGAAQPKAMIVHAKEASQRMFAWGVTGHQDTLYYSSLNAFETFTGGTSGTVNIATGHGDGITHCMSKDGSLFIFTKTDVFILDDSNLTIANWGVYRAPLAGSGGCHSPRHAIAVNNSLFAMTTDGDIYEVLSATELRDYKRASIIEPFFIHTYIKENWDITKIDQFHLAYEPVTKGLCVFGVKAGETKIGECLKFYVNQGKWAPPHDAMDNADDSGFQAAASFQAETSTGFPRLYTQDYEGYTWELETDTKSDNSNGYDGVALMTWLDFDLPGVDKRYKFSVINFKSKGNFELTYKWWVDGAEQAASTITIEASGSDLGALVLGTDSLGVRGIARAESTLGQNGEKIRIQISNDQAGEDFFISHLIFMYLSRGVRRL